MAKNNNKKPWKGKVKVNKKPENDWISALAKESTSSSSNTNTSTNVPVLSKKERIEKRNAKKRRREERKGPSDSDGSRLNEKQRQRKGEQVVNEVDSEELRRKAEFFLDRLSQKVQDSVSRFTEGKTYKERRFEKQYVPKQSKGKATAGQQLSDDVIQVRSMLYAFRLSLRLRVCPQPCHFQPGGTLLAPFPSVVESHFHPPNREHGFLHFGHYFHV